MPGQWQAEAGRHQVIDLKVFFCVFGSVLKLFCAAKTVAILQADAFCLTLGQKIDLFRQEF